MVVHSSLHLHRNNIITIITYFALSTWRWNVPCSMFRRKKKLNSTHLLMAFGIICYKNWWTAVIEKEEKRLHKADLLRLNVVNSGWTILKLLVITNNNWASNYWANVNEFPGISTKALPTFKLSIKLIFFGKIGNDYLFLIKMLLFSSNLHKNSKLIFWIFPHGKNHRSEHYCSFIAVFIYILPTYEIIHLC